MSTVGQARAALGARLRELRRDARLSGRDLATACDWHPSKVSRLELGRQQPSEDDLEAWCHAVDNELVYDDLVATLRNLRSMYLEWRRVTAGGHAPRQRRSIDIESATKLIRWHEVNVIPGLLQSADYARGILRACIDMTGGRDDLDDAVAARMERQKVLRNGARRFTFLIEAGALYRTVGSPEVMAEQMDALIEASRNPRISLGVIELTARYWCPARGFILFDRAMVMVETPSAELTITRPSEIATYERTFALLTESAVFGDRARDLIKGVKAVHANAS
ncbi:helix-turn-helix transcriptional regulator [Nocardia sp. NPDC004604]|uniref:helix-turn-helix domain-containing protein n=1 Tax=Nocardia sp. NPDC004604 TaxID=3157013 RepID=UPI0033BD464B